MHEHMLHNRDRIILKKESERKYPVSYSRRGQHRPKPVLLVWNISWDFIALIVYIQFYTRWQKNNSYTCMYLWPYEPLNNNRWHHTTGPTPSVLQFSQLYGNWDKDISPPRRKYQILTLSIARLSPACKHSVSGTYMQMLWPTLRKWIGKIPMTLKK